MNINVLRKELIGVSAYPANDAPPPPAISIPENIDKNIDNRTNIEDLSIHSMMSTSDHSLNYSESRVFVNGNTIVASPPRVSKKNVSTKTGYFGSMFDFVSICTSSQEYDDSDVVQSQVPQSE